MDPSDRLEEDFQFYLSFFEQNLKELRNEKDKALCQEWLERLELMRGTRKQQRDRNVYLSQLALAMAEGHLCPPFNAPPPRDPLPMPASLFEILRTGVTEFEKPQEKQLRISSSSARADTRGKYGPNVPSGFIKGKWDVNLQPAENTVYKKLQKSQSRKSTLSARVDTSEQCRSNENNNRSETREKIVNEEPQTNQSGAFPPSARGDTSGKQRNNWKINGQQTPEKAVYEEPQTNQSETFPPSARGDTSGKQRNNGKINGQQTPEKVVCDKPPAIESVLSSPSERGDTSGKHHPNENINTLQTPETFVYDEPQTNDSEVSSPSTNVKSSGRYQPIGNISILLSPRKTVYEKPQTNQSLMSSLSAKTVASGGDQSYGNTNRIQDPETIVYEKSQTNQSDMSSPSARADTSGKYWANAAFGREKSKWNINDLRVAGKNVIPNSQSTLSEMSSLGSLSDKSVEKWLATNYNEDESKLALYGIDELVPRNHQMMLFKIPLFYASSETSTEPLSETLNDEEKNRWFNDESSAADEFDSRKSQTLNSGLPPCISSNDFNEEQLHEDGNTAGNNKQSNEIVLPVEEMELHSRNPSDPQTDGLPNFQINPVENIQQQKSVLQPANYSYYQTGVLSNQTLDSENELDYQTPGAQSTNFFDSRINVLSKANFNPYVDLSLHRPVVPRTCPGPSQMPLVEEKPELQLTDDAFVTSQWEKIFKQDEAVPHADSLASLLSYSKGQWLDQSCDSESFRSAFSFQSVTSEIPTEIDRHSYSPSVHSELRRKISLSEKEIQSISLYSMQSRKSTPALSLTSVISKGEQQYCPMSTVENVQDQFTQTQPQHHLPQEKNIQKKPMFLPVYILSADEKPFLLHNTPLTAFKIHGGQLITPKASQQRSRPNSQQLPKGILRKTPNQISKINARVYFPRT